MVKVLICYTYTSKERLGYSVGDAFADLSELSEDYINALRDKLSSEMNATNLVFTSVTRLDS